jgi:hypothetical protein
VSAPRHWDSTVGTTTNYGLSRLDFESRYSQEIFIFFQALWGPPGLLFNGYQGSLPGLQRQRCDTYQSPPSSAELRKEWSLLALLLHPFIAWTGIILALPLELHLPLFVNTLIKTTCRNSITVTTLPGKQSCGTQARKWSKVKAEIQKLNQYLPKHNYKFLFRLYSYMFRLTPDHLQVHNWSFKHTEKRNIKYALCKSIKQLKLLNLWKIVKVINRNNMCGQRSVTTLKNTVYRFYFLVIPKLPQHNLQSEYLDVDSFQI